MDKVYSIVDSGNYVIRMKKNGSKDYYFSSDAKGPVRIRERGCTYGKTSVFLNQYGNKGPQEIIFTHKMLKFEISLKQINYPGWN